MSSIERPNRPDWSDSDVLYWAVGSASALLHDLAAIVSDAEHERLIRNIEGIARRLREDHARQTVFDPLDARSSGVGTR